MRILLYTLLTSENSSYNSPEVHQRFERTRKHNTYTYSLGKNNSVHIRLQVLSNSEEHLGEKKINSGIRNQLRDQQIICGIRKSAQKLANQLSDQKISSKIRKPAQRLANQLRDQKINSEISTSTEGLENQLRGYKSTQRLTNQIRDQKISSGIRKSAQRL